MIVRLSYDCIVSRESMPTWAFTCSRPAFAGALCTSAMVAKLPQCKVCHKANSGKYSCPVDHVP